MTDAARWTRTKEVFQAALDRPAAERAVFVRDACSGDRDLQANVESLLMAHDQAGSFAKANPFVTDVSASELPTGQRIGAYEIVASLGAGGMGEVYRARDTRLNRDVAIKILPRAYTADSDRITRFDREAKTLASLNHPNIAAIYGVEQANGLTALVMEFVDGDDLSQRIARGAISIDEALPIALQIAEALEAAHEHGIIHRDLKPANVKVRDDGTVKVLDFGLAKTLDATALPSSITQSPTITTPAMTHTGVIMGTAPYMSPEQAKGRTVDKRSDVWAFGCLLFEMLTGRRAFEGEDVSDTLAAILRGEPDWNALPGDCPQAVTELIKRSLQKDRRWRIGDIAAALFVLRDLTGPAIKSRQLENEPSVAWVRGPAVAIAAALLIGGAGAGAAVWFLARTSRPSVVRTTIEAAGPLALALSNGDRDLAITPDGSRIIYRNNNQIMVRALDQLEPTVLSSGFTAQGPRGLFTSPDGRWVGFFDRNILLKKISITGGPPVIVYESPLGSASRGGTWGEDGTIIFATLAPATGLLRVSASGGTATVLTKPDAAHGEGDHFWPELLPGSKAVLYTITPANGGIETAQIAVLDLRTGTSKVLIRGGSHAQYVPTGHLLYGVPGGLRAVAFDLKRLEVLGTPVPVLDGVITTDQGAVDAAISSTGSLVYVPGGAGDRRTVALLDRQGRGSTLPGLGPDSYLDVRVSPDGKRLALATFEDVWTYDFARGARSRLTTRAAPDGRANRTSPGLSPLWTPDGRRLIFTSTRDGFPELYSRSADGSGVEERFLARRPDAVTFRAMAWSPDARQLLFATSSGKAGIWQMLLRGSSEPSFLVRGNYPALSPDGRWIAYESAASGAPEIYVERYPDLGSRLQISTDGGRIPLWSRDGRELFFSGFGGQMFGVSVHPGPVLEAERPELLFQSAMFLIAGTRAYDILPDGRFVAIRQADTGADSTSNIIVVQNWFEELKRLVPNN